MRRTAVPLSRSRRKWRFCSVCSTDGTGEVVHRRCYLTSKVEARRVCGYMVCFIVVLVIRKLNGGGRRGVKST